MASFFDSIFYGGGDEGGFYGASDRDVPVNLAFYRTNVDNVYVFHWGFQEAFISPGLATADFDLQLDNTPSFGSPNLVTFNTLTALQYFNGNVRKGFAIEVAPRIDGSTQVWYARIRTKFGLTSSAWSLPLIWMILQKTEVQEAENIINNLPDYHVYGKEDLLKPVLQRSSKLYKIADMYGKELDQVTLENTLTVTNNYISLCRDEQLFDNFGTLFNFSKPQTLQFVDYRGILENLVLASLDGGTLDSIQRVVRSFTGVTPDLLLIKDREDFFLNTILEIPPEAPNGTRKFFSTSSIFSPGTLVVLKNGVAQDPGYYTVYESPLSPNNPANTGTRDAYVEDRFAVPLPGFKMTTAPGALDVLTVVFDIGERTDPTPVIFDLTNSLMLAGVITFTHGDTEIIGVGTSFLSALHIGDLITDAAGLVLGLVDVVNSNINLTLKRPWIGDTGTGTGYKLNYNSAVHLSGIITFQNGSTAVTGSSTNFGDELVPGDTIMDDYGVTGKILSITDSTNLVLTAPWTGSHPFVPIYYPLTTTPYPNVHTRKLIYEDMTLWSKSSLADGLIIRILNPGEFVLPKSILEMLVKLLIPTHVLVFFEYVT
jgi:hypothetical protein